MAKKILLIDDDEDFVEINKTILDTKGYDVDTATTTQEALSKLRSKRYDLAIIDLIMEELDSGFTITYAIREDKQIQDLPVMMLTSAQKRTGFTFELSKDQEWMKVDDFVEKPLKPSELLARVEKLLGKEKTE